MNIGKFLRKSVSNYLDNPIILAPFAIMGLITTGLGIISSLYLNSISSQITMESVRSAVLSESASSYLMGIFGKYILLIIVCGFFLSFISSFFHAFSIGLAKQIAKGKKPTLQHGFSALRSGLRVFSFKILIWGFTLIAAVLISIPAALMFGLLGLVFAGLCVIFFSILLQFVGFFGKQAIVLDGLWAWAAFQKSYNVIRKNLGNVLLLLGAYLFTLVAFIVFKQIFITLANYLMIGFGLVIFAQAAEFIFTFLILSPLFVIIKTSYFLKSRQK
jgi:hypothetical protein